MADHTDGGKRGTLHSKPSGNPYASLSAHDEDEASLRQEPTDAQKHAYIKKLQNPYAHIAIFGDLGVTSNSTKDSTTDYSQLPHSRDLLKVDTKLQQRLPLNDSLESGELTEEFVSKILFRCLPKSLRARDRKVINNMATKFVVQANILTAKQKTFVSRRLLSMEPEEGRQLEAARTTPDSIKIKLEGLLDEAKKQR